MAIDIRYSGTLSGAASGTAYTLHSDGTVTTDSTDEWPVRGRVPEIAVAVAAAVAIEPCGPPAACDDWPEKVEHQGRSRRSKNKPSLADRTAKRRRRTALAKHHRKVMAMVVAGTPGPYPKRPPKPR